MGEIYIEIVPLESGLRVTAVDADTGAEVVFAAPSSCSRQRIDDLAKSKIARRIRLDQESDEGLADESGDLGTPVDPSERGRIV